MSAAKRRRSSKQCLRRRADESGLRCKLPHVLQGHTRERASAFACLGRACMSGLQTTRFETPRGSFCLCDADTRCRRCRNRTWSAICTSSHPKPAYVGHNSASWGTSLAMCMDYGERDRVVVVPRAFATVARLTESLFNVAILAVTNRYQKTGPKL
jgi:hypothetical protein